MTPTPQPTETEEPDSPDSQLVSLSIREAARRLGTFALLLDGNALAPRARHGDLLVIDAAAVPSPGDAVVIETRGGGYGAMLLNGDGDAFDGRGNHLPRGAFTVAGVVTEIRPAA